MAARGLRAGLRGASHTKCLIRAKSRSVCVRNAEVSVVSNGTLLWMCRSMILCVLVQMRSFQHKQDRNNRG